jgi:hypothetical protein
MAEEALCPIGEDLAVLEAVHVCERRVMEEEKVPVAEKIISLSDSDASFIVKGEWNTGGYRPQLARSGSGFVTALVLPRGNAAAVMRLKCPLPRYPEIRARDGIGSERRFLLGTR